MDLGYNTLGALPFLRAQAESRFTETFTFSRTELVEDANGVKKPTDVPLYTGVAGRLKFTSRVVSDATQGGQILTVQERRVDVAIGAAPDVRPQDTVTVTASTVDPQLVGRVLRVEGLPSAGQVTARRFTVSEVA